MTLALPWMATSAGLVKSFLLLALMGRDSTFVQLAQPGEYLSALKGRNVRFVTGSALVSAIGPVFPVFKLCNSF